MRQMSPNSFQSCTKGRVVTTQPNPNPASNVTHCTNPKEPNPNSASNMPHCTHTKEPNPNPTSKTTHCTNPKEPNPNPASNMPHYTHTLNNLILTQPLTRRTGPTPKSLIQALTQGRNYRGCSRCGRTWARGSWRPVAGAHRHIYV